MLGEFAISESPISGYIFVELGDVYTPANIQNTAEISVLPSISASISVLQSQSGSISVKPTVS